MTYERELKKYQDAIGVKKQYNVTVDFYHHPTNHEVTYPLVLESTLDKKESKELVRLYKKLIFKKGDKYFLDMHHYEVAVEVTGKDVYVTEEYVLEL